MGRYFWRAWLLCGLLDIGYAAIMSVAQSGTVAGMLRTVASGPFGDDARNWGIAGALAGLLVHFAIMAAMIAVYGWLILRTGFGRLPPLLCGLLYGVASYLVMYWIVLPLRWPAAHPSINPMTVAWALFAHCILVGLPAAFIARSLFKKGIAG